MKIVLGIRQRTHGPSAVAEEGEDEDERRHVLIRTINNPRSRFMMFALVAENKDLTVLGLSYATALRILLDKDR